jgi:uncharacterized protein YciI
MSKRYVFFYFMKDLPEKINKVALDHIKYWHKCEVPNYAGGPFADHSGGLISFSALNMEEAQHYAKNDPFVLEGILENHWLKEWTAK